MCDYCEPISNKNLKDNEIVISGIYCQYPNIEGTPYMYCPICR